MSDEDFRNWNCGLESQGAGTMATMKMLAAIEKIEAQLSC